MAFVFNLFIDNSNEAKRKKMQIAQLEAKRREAGLQSEYASSAALSRSLRHSTAEPSRPQI